MDERNKNFGAFKYFYSEAFAFDQSVMRLIDT